MKWKRKRRFAALLGLATLLACSQGPAKEASEAQARPPEAAQLQPAPSDPAPRAEGAALAPRAVEARAKVQAGAFLLDVRTPEEFAAGHLDGAVNVPVQVLAERLAEIPQDREVVVYCRSGGRSAQAADILSKEGHQVFDLGAMENWDAPAAAK